MPGKNSNKPTSNVKTDLDEKIQILIEKAVSSWQNEYKEEISKLKKELEVVKSSQDFISSKYEDLQTDYKKLQKKNKEQEKQILVLQDQASKIEENNVKADEKVDAIEQYGRRQNLEIVGVPYTEGENTNEIVTEIAKLIEVDVKPDDISTSHRLPVRSRSSSDDNNRKAIKFHAPIIVRFVGRDIRNKIFANRKLARNLDLEKFSVKGTERLFINENLTQQRKKLFWLAKQKMKAADFKFIWTSNGSIFVRKSEDSDTINIKSALDLDLIA